MTFRPSCDDNSGNTNTSRCSSSEVWLASCRSPFWQLPIVHVAFFFGIHYTYIHTYIHTYLPMYLRTYIHMYVYTYIYISFIYISSVYVCTYIYMYRRYICALFCVACVACVLFVLGAVGLGCLAEASGLRSARISTKARKA